MNGVSFYFLVGNLLLCFSGIQSTRVESACYGVDTCNSFNLTCTGGRVIEILSAQYGLRLNRTGGCKSDNCNPGYKEMCCVRSEGDPVQNYSSDNWSALKEKCSGFSSCTSQVALGPINSNNHSDIAIVTYRCQTGSPRGTTVSPEPLTDSEESNTAAIVVPILVVLLIIVVAVLFFLYWRRKQQHENGEKIDSQAAHNGRAPVQNPGYFDTDKVTGIKKDTADGDLDSEDTYHTIDPNSIPDRASAVPNDYLVLDPPEDEYNTIDPNNVDSKTGASNEYFILEPGAQNTYNEASNDKDYDYNKLNLKSHEIVKDPNYQRLASVDQNPKDEVSAGNEDYSHLGDKLTAEDKSGEIQAGDIKNDDYAHLNKDSV